ncbi:lysine transporter LysE [Endozoicomonas sp. OPT23]|uniref:LysE family translocator n=1 Tax=Endozoicomonas sp. OPT23 TaxID=2072845 RepID=UPI001D7FAF8C|nr:lysine transporter LysE [Endozoicomonas sp. OPT23]
MNVETWIAFITTVSIFCIIPGPTVILAMSQAMVHGKKSVLPLVAGVLAGDLTAMSLSLLGLGAILAASSTLFLVLKWFGVGYLIYLGIKTFFAEVELTSSNKSTSNSSAFSLFRGAFLVTALNPKDIVFFVAFLPQFIEPAEAFLPQILILVVSFLSIVALNITFYTLFAGKLREQVQSYNARKWFNRFSGTALFGAGAITASIKNG